MKKYFLFLLVVGVYSTSVIAANAHKLKIEKAIVFLSGAQLNSTVSVNLPAGETELIFTNVAGDIDRQSLSVNATKDVVVESATFLDDYLADEALSARARALKDSIDAVADEKKLLDNKISTCNVGISVIDANKKVAGENTGLSTAELGKMLDLVNTRYEALRNQKSKLEKQQKKTDELLTKLKKQYNEEKAKNSHACGQIVVECITQAPVKADFAVSYFVAQAGWAPVYDIRVADLSKPAELYFKAGIFQNSGVSWDNVRLELSTGNPRENAQAPELSPWYLSYYTPVATQVRYGMKNMAMASARRVADTAALLDQTVSANAETTVDDYVMVDNGGINTTFDIDLPYTIAADGQKHLVAIRKLELPATYRYFAAPRLDKDVFLQAQLTNWENLDLLPGNSNIFFEGNYVGQGKIDTRNVKDTLTVSLGRDKKVIVERKRDLKFRSAHILNNAVDDAYGYNITVRNTRKDAIRLVIQDQIPVSTDKDIEVNDPDTGGGALDPVTGMLTWNKMLGPGETQSISFGFELRYLRGRTISNMPK